MRKIEILYYLRDRHPPQSNRVSLHLRDIGSHYPLVKGPRFFYRTMLPSQHPSFAIILQTPRITKSYRTKMQFSRSISIYHQGTTSDRAHYRLYFLQYHRKHNLILLHTSPHRCNHVTCIYQPVTTLSISITSSTV